MKSDKYSELAINHNFFIRTVVMELCKMFRTQLIVAIPITLIFGITLLAEAPDFGIVLLVGYFIFCICIFLYKIAKLNQLHQMLTSYEDEILKQSLHQKSEETASQVGNDTE